MIKIDSDYNIICSHGDTLTIKFDIGENTLGEGDTATFSISQDGELMANTTIEGSGQSILKFTISAEEMKKLPVGRMQYDVVIHYADGKEYTIDFVRQLMIVATAH